MASAAEAAEHRTAVSDIATLGIAELVAEWPGLPLDEPEAMRQVLADLLADLTETYAASAAALGADWYDSLRAEANAPGTFVARLPDLPGREQIEASASYAASALYVDTDKALADMAAITDRIIAEADRAAIEVSVEADPAEPRWARVAQPGACAFCALLASRGPAYRTEETAGLAKHGRRYHEHCGCVATPVWPDETFELPDYAEPWIDAYDQARLDLGPGADLSALLSKMREVGDLR